MYSHALVSKELSNLAIPKSQLEKPIHVSDNGLEVLRRRYLRKGPDGKPIESIPEMFWRVASNVALPEHAHGNDAGYMATAACFYDLLTEMRFFPNSPTFTGAGTPLGQLAACFVLAIDDDMGKDSPEGIFNTLRNAALIQQTGGGNGFSFSRLRPKSDPVNSSAGVASGPVGFLRVYDAAFGEIAQGGTRRGANMGVLRVDHPDIGEFIACKATEGAIANFNISVGVTDAFMQAVTDDADFDLVNPHTGKVTRTVRARNLFEKIVHHAHRNGEPGVLFLDAANRSNPVPHLYELEATNPCGEQWLGPYENCCLGSINLARHVTTDGRIDWEALEQTVVESTRFLDDVVSANKYVPAVPQLQDAAHRVRRIGLGIMGLADVMYMSGVRYGDQESLDLAGQVMEFVRYHAMLTSIELATERGPFPAIAGSIYDPENLKWQPPTPLRPYSHSFGRPQIDWNIVVQGIRTHGIRNGAQTTVAPTGTIGTVTGCEGYGCEPVFALAYTRYVKEANGDVPLTYVSPLFLLALDRAGITGERRERIVEQIVLTGTCQDIDELPRELQHTFVVSQDITPAEHVLMQATLQRYVDNSISKTCNFPPEAMPEDVAKAYMQAWQLGCKGLTVYVTGSRQEVVLETKATAESKKAGSSEPAPNGKVSAHETLVAVPHHAEMSEANGNGASQPQGYSAVDYDVKRPRPRRLHGATYRRLTPLGTAYVTVNDTDEGEPFEVFMNVGKAGSDVAAVSEALGRLISLILRMPSSLSPTERLQQVVYQLNGIGGGRHLGFGPQRVRSLPDAIAQVLTEHLEQTPTPAVVTAAVPAEQLALPIPKQIGDLCPDCGNSTLLNVEGCVKCHVCGHSEC
jgi:ribonucleoside-diphosphate reductase alpha chain